MNTDTLIILGVIAGIVLVGFLLKSFFSVVFVLGVAYLLFHVGFLWGVDDLNKYLHLDAFLKPEVNQQIQETYDEFTQKREDTGIIETELVRKTINDSINTALTNASNEINNIDKEQLIQDLNTKLENFDTTTVANVLNELRTELAKYNVTPEEITTTTIDTATDATTDTTTVQP